MTSDINITAATVVAIQGESISTITPTDGYVLTWSASDGYWVPKPAPTTGLRKDYFINSGTWTCPVGVTNVLVIGAGGGGGGSGARDYYNGGGAGAGGSGSIQQVSYVSVVPSTVYTITIGAGGSGGMGASNGSNSNGTDGSDGTPTTIVNSGTTYFYALGGGRSSFDGVVAFAGFPTWTLSNGTSLSPLPGNGQSFSTFPSTKNYIGGYISGIFGSNATGNINGGGSGGGAGPQGAGGNGGNGSTGSNGSNGSSGASNSGAGAGSGGGGGGFGAGGNGGNGGSGYLYIVY